MNKILGRPRSQAADDAIIAAASKIFYKQRYQEVSMEAIAIEAGVSKATLYRRWANKATLAVEVLVQVVLQEQLEYRGGEYRVHLIKNLHALRDMLVSDYADVIVAIIAETQSNEVLKDLFYRKFLLPVQAIGDRDLELAIVSGQVKEFVDKDLLFDQLFGLFYYRLLVAHKAVKDEEITFIVDAFLTVAGKD